MADPFHQVHLAVSRRLVLGGAACGIHTEHHFLELGAQLCCMAERLISTHQIAIFHHTIHRSLARQFRIRGHVLLHNPIFDWLARASCLAQSGARERLRLVQGLVTTDLRIEHSGALGVLSRRSIVAALHPTPLDNAVKQQTFLARLPGPSGRRFYFMRHI